MSYNQLNISVEQAEKIMLDNYGILDLNPDWKVGLYEKNK